MAEIVTPDILSNMGSLEKMISERGYTTASVPMQGENVVRRPYDASEASAQDQQIYADYGALAPQDAGVVTQQPLAPQQPVYNPQPQISPAQYQAAMEYAANAQRQLAEAERNRMEAEDLAFLNGISHLPQLEQDREILIRYGQRMESQLQQTQGELQAIKSGSEQERQADAKESVAWHLAMEFGLRWEDQRVQDALLSSVDRPTMNTIVSALSGAPLEFVNLPMEQRRQARQRMPAAQRQVQLNPQQIAAQQRQGMPGAGQGSNRGGRQTVKPYSGDISGLIRTRGYQAVAG